MNPIFRKLLFIISLTLFSFSGNAQGKFWEAESLAGLNADQLTDQQVMMFYDYAMQSKMTEGDLLKMTTEKGLPALQFSKLKERMWQIRPTGRNGKAQEVPSEENGSRSRFNEELFYTPITVEEQIDSSIFGAELFSKSSSVFEPNLRIATPSSYVIGPDDELIISVYGLSEKKYELTVNEEGEIFIPNVGPVNVNGMTMEDAEILIKTRLSATIYSSLQSGKTRMTLALGKIKSIRVSVIGQAKKPGSYTVSSLTALYNILYLCGGPAKDGSFRKIEVIRGNKLFRTADLYQFLLRGDQTDNILLREGDVIRIPYCEDRVSISGKIRRAAKFEMLEEETMKDLLEFCGGFDATAFKGSLTMFRMENEGKRTIDIEENKFPTFIMKNGDEVFVSPVREIFTNRVAVFGSVHREGYYELSQGLDLKSLITKAGGLLPDAHPGNASIFRYAENRIPFILSVNIDSVMKGTAVIPMQKNDSVYINSLFDFRDSLYVTVAGYVNQSKKVFWRENLSLFDAIMESGGIRNPGDSNRIEISRRVLNADVSQKNHQESQTIFHSLHDNISLRPYDQIFVRNAPGFVTQRMVMVTGEVRFPGNYILEKSSERLSDLFNRCGGFKASADSFSITVRRKSKSSLNRGERERLFQRLLDINPDSIDANEKLRSEIFKSYDLVSVKTFNLEGRYESGENLILEDGDIITVEKNNFLVKISGEVYYPTIIAYKKGQGLRKYIRQAGYFTPSANRKSVMVIYPDGRAKSVKKFLFFKNYPPITSRCEIFVPQKAEKEKNPLTTGELALIVTSMGILANLIIALFK